MHEYDIYGIVADKEGVIWKSRGVSIMGYYVLFTYEFVDYANCPNLFDKLIYIEQEVKEDLFKFGIPYEKVYIFENEHKLRVRIINGKFEVYEKDNNRQEIFDIQNGKLVKTMQTYFYLPAGFVFGLEDNGNTVIYGYHGKYITKSDNGNVVMTHKYDDMTRAKFNYVCNEVLKAICELKNRYIYED
jgi:hypothetical protein